MSQNVEVLKLLYLVENPQQAPNEIHFSQYLLFIKFQQFDLLICKYIDKK